MRCSLRGTVKDTCSKVSLISLKKVIKNYMTESEPQTGSKARSGQSQAALQSDFTVVMVALVEMPA